MNDLQAKSTNTLALCPFCGGENVRTTYKDTFSGDFRRGVYCADCCGGIYPYYETEAEAIAAWNSRAKPPCGGGYCPLCGAYDEWESYQHSIPATEENMAKFGWVRERTCHIEGSYYDELFDETCTNLSCGHAIWQNESPNYCSECGAKVVGE